MRTWTPALLCLVSTLASACGGGSSGAGAPPPGPPDVAVLFPHVGGLTDAATIVVRDTAQGAGLLGVELAGVAATSGDGFATWQATVPLALGDNELAAQATFASGLQTATATVIVRREVGLPHVPLAVVYDETSQTANAADVDVNRVWSVHLSTGDVALVSGPGVGSGPLAFGPLALALDSVGGRLFVANFGSQTVTAIDLATGSRSVVTSDDVGTGPTLGNGPALAYDADSGTLYAATNAALAVTAVNPATGDRTLISGAGAGSGPALQGLYSLAYESAGKRLIVGGMVAGQAAILAVNPVSGGRMILSGAGVGSGTPYNAVHDLCVDSAAGLCYSRQSVHPPSIVRTDLATGVRSNVLLAGPAVLLDASAVAFNSAGPRLIVADTARVGIATVNLLDGAVAWSWLPARGTGPTMADVRDVALLPDQSTVAVLDDTQDGDLTYVDLATGARSVAPGGGVTVYGSRAMVWDDAGDRALLASETPVGWSIVAVAHADATRTLLSGGATGSGPALVSPQALALDAQAQLLYVHDGAIQGLVAVDLATGARTIVSDPTTGFGPQLQSWRGCAFETLSGRVLTAGTGSLTNLLLGVNPATGDRALLSGDGIGLGDSGFWGRAILPTSDGQGALLDGQGALVFVDLLDGDRTVLSGTDGAMSVGQGPALTYLTDELAPAGVPGVVLMHDDVTNALLLVDVVTVERLIVSQ